MPFWCDFDGPTCVVQGFFRVSQRKMCGRSVGMNHVQHLFGSFLLHGLDGRVVARDGVLPIAFFSRVVPKFPHVPHTFEDGRLGSAERIVYHCSDASCGSTAFVLRRGRQDDHVGSVATSSEASATVHVHAARHHRLELPRGVVRTVPPARPVGANAHFGTGWHRHAPFRRARVVPTRGMVSEQMDGEEMSHLGAGERCGRRTREEERCTSKAGTRKVHTGTRLQLPKAAIFRATTSDIAARAPDRASKRSPVQKADR